MSVRVVQDSGGDGVNRFEWAEKKLRDDVG